MAVWVSASAEEKRIALEQIDNGMSQNILVLPLRGLRHCTTRWAARRWAGSDERERMDGDDRPSRPPSPLTERPSDGGCLTRWGRIMRHRLHI